MKKRMRWGCSGRRIVGAAMAAAVLAAAAGCGSMQNSVDLTAGIGSGQPGERISAGDGAQTGRGGGTSAGGASDAAVGDQTGAGGTGKDGAGEQTGAGGTGMNGAGDGAKTGGTGSAGNRAKTGVSAAAVDSASAVTDFGLRLLRQSFGEGEENVMVSPLSVLSALTMTANGAGGETLRQMEEVFGLSVPELNEYLSAYRETLPAGEKYKLNIANAIWFADREGFCVEEDFLRKNADYFQAGLYKAPFDESTCKDINSWVEEHTDGMVRDILDRISPDVVMYLVNAIAFDGEWESIYKENQVWEGVFTKEDKTTGSVEQMYSREDRYLESEQAQGFLKFYADRKYAYAALLPKEGVTVRELLASLDGEKLHGMLAEPLKVQVDAAIPKYKSEYGCDLSLILQEMGMKDAFDEYAADFSAMGSVSGNIYIGRVLHKTFAAVDEKGTRAGAATVVEMKEESAAIEPETVMTVHLDRPFVYLIVDCDECLPVFMGAVMEIE